MRMSTYFKRIFKVGLMNFWRNGWVTIATILVMVLMLFVIGSLMFSSVLLTSAINRIERKIDISVYFKTDASEDEIARLERELLKLPQVENVEYVSRDDALKNFYARHADNALITQSLEELGENPLGASLNVKAKESEQYENIARFLSAATFAPIVDKVNYFQNKIVIDRLSMILSAARRVGFGITLVLAGIVILVVFNTIRMAIYMSREEIAVMRLVGAANNYIRGPFVVAGMLYGFASAIITTIAFYPLTLWLGPKADSFFGGPNLFNYYISNFFQIFIMLLGAGILLGAISSFIAVRRYLNV